MRIESIKTIKKSEKFSGFLNNKLLIKGLEAASNNGALFAAGASLVLTSFVRPFSIMATPNVEKENKQYACAKSIASGLIGFALTFLITTPIVGAVKNIQKNPEKFLGNKAINAFKESGKTLKTSSKFKFINQFIKLGSGLLTVAPKTFLTCALIPPIMALVFNKDKSEVEEKPLKPKSISFKGRIPTPSFYKRMVDKISQELSKVFNSSKVQNFAEKYHDTNLAQHMFSGSDVLATGLFINYTAKNKNIKEDRKKALMCNAGIATGLTVIGGYITSALLKKPSEFFIKKFKEANKNLPQLDKCIEGFKNARAAMILGGMYYIITPILATFLAEKITNKTKGINSAKG